MKIACLAGLLIVTWSVAAENRIEPSGLPQEAVDVEKRVARAEYLRPDQDRELPELESGLTIYECEFGWVLAADLEEAGQIASDTRQAIDTFEYHFDMAAGRGVIANRIGFVQSQLDTFTDWGARWWLPASWYSMETFQSGPADKGAFHQEVDESGKIYELTSGEDRALGPTQFAVDTVAAGSFRNTLTRHELAHVLFTRQLLKARPGSEGAFGYRHPCPDWLEELAAIICEKGKGDIYWTQVEKEFAAGNLPALSEYLESRHPGFNGALAKDLQDADKNLTEGGLDPKLKSSTRVVAMSPEAARQSALFYGQARMFADFMYFKTGDRLVLRKLADGLGQGTPFATWLASHGKSHGLPDNLQELDAQWTRWISARFENRRKRTGENERYEAIEPAAQPDGDGSRY